MALLNPTFADAGALPGEAAHWTLSAVTSLQRVAAFGTAGREDFESWTAHLSSLADVVAARGFFGNDGSDEEVSLDAIAVGDRLRVRPGEKVPVDGEADAISSARRDWTVALWTAYRLLSGFISTR